MQALAERKATVVSLSKHPVGFIYSLANIKGMFWICPQMACLVWSKPTDIIHKVHNESRLSKTMATIQTITILWSHRKVWNMLHIWDHTSQVKDHSLSEMFVQMYSLHRVARQYWQLNLGRNYLQYCRMWVEFRSFVFAIACFYSSPLPPPPP